MVGATGTGIKAGLNDATFQPCFLTGTFGNVPLQDVIVRVQYKHQGVAWDDSLGYFDNPDGTGQFRNKDDNDVDVGTGGMSPIVRSSCALKHTCSVCPQGDHIAVNTTSDCEACPAISTNPGGAPSRRFLMGANTLKFHQGMGDEKDECDVTNVVETFEKATYGFYFDGTSTCLQNDHSNAGASSKLTLSFWMRGPYTEGRSTTFLNLGGAGGGGTQDAFRLALDDKRRVYVSSELDNGQQWAVSASVPLVAGDGDNGIYPWQHVVLAVDTTQAVASNRVKWYIDGVRQTPSTTGLTYPSLNFASSPYQTANTRNWIGCGDGSGNPYNHFKGWLAQIVRVDGQALGPKIFRADNGKMRLGTRDFPRDFSGTEILMKSMDESLVLGNKGFMVTFDDVNEPGRDYSGTTGKQYTTLGATGAAGHVLDGPRLNVSTSYSGQLKASPENINCASTICVSSDAATCCATSSGAAPSEGGDKAKCNTITNPSTFCSGDTYSGQLKTYPENIDCSGTTCVSGTDTATCCAGAEACEFTDGSAQNDFTCVCGLMPDSPTPLTCNSDKGYICYKGVGGDSCRKTGFGAFGYVKIITGKCGSETGRRNIDDQETCEKAASGLNFDDTSAYPEENSETPPSCYINEKVSNNIQLMFNYQKDSTEGSQNDKNSICIVAPDCTESNGE